MVKLEELDGEPVLIAPQHVTSIASVRDRVRIWDVGGKYVDVKGTPEEVHAKLFPEVAKNADSFGFSVMERNEAMLRVLHAVADKRPLDWKEVSDLMKANARKALGREGT